MYCVILGVPHPDGLRVQSITQHSAIHSKNKTKSLNLKKKMEIVSLILNRKSFLKKKYLFRILLYFS